MVQQAHSTIPNQKVDVGVTLAAEEEKKRTKAAREVVENSRREILIYEIYQLPPEKQRIDATRRPPSAQSKRQSAAGEPGEEPPAEEKKMSTKSCLRMMSMLGACAGEGKETPCVGACDATDPQGRPITLVDAAIREHGISSAQRLDVGGVSTVCGGQLQNGSGGGGPAAADRRVAL